MRGWGLLPQRVLSLRCAGKAYRDGDTGSAKPFLNASDPPGQLHILREESNAAGM